LDIELELSADELIGAFPDVADAFDMIKGASTNPELRAAGVPVELRNKIDAAIRRVLSLRGEPYVWNDGWDSDGTTVHLWIQQDPPRKR
jgi:hypothetical protein